jgi:soluble lytic murein transglycosylase-like protein
MLGKAVTAQMLLDPYTNIQAGTAYIAKQTAKYKTPSDIYSAYNAGSVRRLANGDYVNQRNVDNFMKWYSLYAPGAVPAAIPQAAIIPSGGKGNTLLYAGVGIGIVVIGGIIYFAGKKSR